MEEKGQDIHGSQQRGTMLLAMAEVVFQMISLGLESIVVFVLDFPSCSSNLGKVNNICSRDRVIGYEAVLRQDFTRVFIFDDQFQPVDLQGIVAIA